MMWYHFDLGNMNSKGSLLGMQRNTDWEMIELYEPMYCFPSLNATQSVPYIEPHVLSHKYNQPPTQPTF